MKRDITLYVGDIVDNIDKAVAFIGNCSYELFSEDEKTAYAVVRCLEIIGEASKHIPEELRKRWPDIPWKEMAGMRDKCIHDYIGIDYEVIWTAVKDELPRIRQMVHSVRDELRQSEKK